MQYDLSTWTDLANVGAAWSALLISLLSLRLSIKAQNLAEQNEQRRKPTLKLYIFDCFFMRDPGATRQIYAFDLSISNPSDIDNSIAKIELSVLYRTRSGASVTVRIPAAFAHSEQLALAPENTLCVPSRIDAHQTIKGWSAFNLDDVIFENVLIESFSLIITDSHDLETSITPIAVQERNDEKKRSKANIRANE
jgi:hypothetical protein